MAKADLAVVGGTVVNEDSVSQATVLVDDGSSHGTASRAGKSVARHTVL